MKLPTVLNLKSGLAAAHSRRNKIKLDPLRALEPACKKPSTIEAQRVIAVLEDTKRSCKVVAVMPYILNNLKERSTALAQQLVEGVNGEQEGTEQWSEDMPRNEQQ